MKVKKSIILMIALLFPLIVTSFVGLYMYGYIGNWTNNQEKFKETMFSPDVETTASIDNYLKVNYQNYAYNKDNFKVFDYDTEGFTPKGALLPSENGNYTDTTSGFSIASASLSTINDGVTHPFFLTNINHNKVTPKQVVMLVVQYDLNDVEESYARLARAYEEFDEMYSGKLDEEQKGSTGGATTSGTVSASYPIYDKHAVIHQTDTTATTPFVVRITPVRSYALYELDESNERIENAYGEYIKEDATEYSKLGNALFALVEYYSDYTTAPLCYGEVKDICATGTQVANRFDSIKGVTVVDSDLKSLENAGYFKFIWPTILWQCAIALAVSGLLAFAFYKTWMMDEDKKDENLNKVKKNQKSNKVVKYFKGVFSTGGWFTALFIAMLAALVLIEAVAIGFFTSASEKYVSSLGIFTGVILLCLVAFAVLTVKKLKSNSSSTTDQVLFGLNAWWLIVAVFFIFKGFDSYLLYLWIISGVISISLTVLRVLYKPTTLKQQKEQNQDIAENSYFKNLFSKYGYILPIASALVVYVLLLLADLMNAVTFIENASTIWLVIDSVVMLFLVIYLPLVSLSELKNKQLGCFDLILIIFDIVTLLLGITFVLLGGHVFKYVLWLILLIIAALLTTTRLQSFNKKK